MPVPMPIKRVLRRTPLYPVYLRFAPSAREARDRSRRRVVNWARALHGQAPLPLLPPASLFYLVTGNTDLDWFVSSGRMGAESISAILEKNGLSFARMGAILDFGCGVGRVLRHWSDVEGPPRSPRDRLQPRAHRVVPTEPAVRALQRERAHRPPLLCVRDFRFRLRAVGLHSPNARAAG